MPVTPWAVLLYDLDRRLVQRTPDGRHWLGFVFQDKGEERRRRRIAMPRCVWAFIFLESRAGARVGRAFWVNGRGSGTGDLGGYWVR
jgi:hypothetical protein